MDANTDTDTDSEDTGEEINRQAGMEARFSTT